MKSIYSPITISDEFASRLRAMPKIELHVHLEGATDAATVWGAVNKLNAARIGHGVRAVEDESLLAYLAMRQIPLEVCPHGNYRLKVTPLDQPHQIRKLVDAGVFCTINSDDPPMFSTDLNSEYILLAQQGFSLEELWQLNLNGLEASFLTENEKAVYRKEWAAFLKNNLEV